MRKKAAKKRPAKKVARTPSIIEEEKPLESKRIDRDESGTASDTMIPEIPIEMVKPIVSNTGFERGEMGVQPKKPSNKEVAGASEHVSVSLRRYEWLDILDTVDFMDGHVGLAAKRIRSQV